VAEIEHTEAWFFQGQCHVEEKKFYDPKDSFTSLNAAPRQIWMVAEACNVTNLLVVPFEKSLAT
jgi:hypothetical protein